MTPTNDGLVTWVSAHFLKRYDPAVAWHGAVGSHLWLPRLRGLWPFSSTSGTNVADVSGQGRTITNNAAATFATYNTLIPYAQMASASSQYFSRADEADLSITGALSLGGWFYFDSVGARAGLIGKSGASPDISYHLHRTAGNNIAFVVSVDGSTLVTVTHTITVAVNTWYFCAGTYNPSTEIRVYVGSRSNSISYVSNTTTIPASVFDGTNALEIGRVEGGNYLNGRASLCWLSATNHSDPLMRMMWFKTRAAFGS